jgi:hypothetical protein
MKSEWLIMPETDSNGKDLDLSSKLSQILGEIDEGRGWRFTQEQADTLAKLVDSVIVQIKNDIKKRNQERKKSPLLLFK